MHLFGTLPARHFSHHVVWVLFLGAGIMEQKLAATLPSEKKRYNVAPFAIGAAHFLAALDGKVQDCTFVSESVPHSTSPTPTSSPPSPHSRPLQAGFPGLCQHAEWGGVPRPSWTRCPAAPHSGVGGPVEKCPSAADGERSTAPETVGSPACV